MIDFRKSECIILFIASVMLTSAVEAQSQIDLSGQWMVRIALNDEYDPATTSENEQNAKAFQPVRLPGTLRDSGLGDH